ncbi:MAG: acyl-ACP--UDP-N-acetylglucosamine O-acyltransferase [Gammaproteobacteria bacterium]|jgi:UDP-N-acetylglucosamine acyltransferase|nr:acyl-ACP--UDP-N-acetylglucosamine O-acyltransferase [Gammaproteobacteria bacterium]
MSNIHATAIIDPGAEIADGVVIGPYSVIGDGVRIGAGSEIGSHVVIKGPTSIGEQNRIFQFASIGDEPQDKKYAGETTRLEIGDRNTIREYCSLNRGTANDQGVTRLGNDNWIMAYVHIAHDCDVGNQVIMANNVTLAGHVHVGDHVIMGGFSGAHQFCSIGAHAFLGMYAGVNRDVPPYVTVSGNPAEPKGVNLEGLKRRGFEKDQLRNIRNAYRVLYRSGMRLQEATEEIARLSETQSELTIFLDFLTDQSRRSIIR